MKTNNQKNKKVSKTVVVVGNNYVGKTSILTQFTKSRFNEEYRSTIGVDFQSKEITINEQQIYLNIWDVNGEERDNTILDSKIYSSAHCFVVVVSYDDISTAHSLLDWLSFLRAKYQSPNLDKNIRDIPIFIVINKEDINEKKFNRAQIERIIKDEYSFVNVCELNAMNNQSVTILFKTMSAKMTGQTIDEAGLDITSESIVQITPVHFKCMCLKCQ